jgi:Family of unknown function (DUF6884)
MMGGKKIKKFVLISCASKKLPRKSRANDLYISPLFKLNLKYAKTFSPDGIFILSAKHGLLDLDKEIEPYDETLNDMYASEIKSWANRVLNQLRQKADVKKDCFIFLAGKNYRKYLIPHLSLYEVPLEGLAIGKQLQYLKRKVGS